MSNKILVVDDDLHICELLKLYLENENYTVFVANDGKAAVETFAAKSPDLVLLDIMLPKMDGWQVCREIRKTSSAPIIMLSAKGETFDKVLGLELGADDYVTKPFEAKEVMARIKAVLRRSKGDSDANTNEKKTVVYDKLEINIVNYELKVNGVAVDTPPKELELIYHFASNPNRVYTRGVSATNLKPRNNSYGKRNKASCAEKPYVRNHTCKFKYFYKVFPAFCRNFSDCADSAWLLPVYSCKQLHC